MAHVPRSLNREVVVITGAARGIGFATAEALARAGARVAIGDLDGELAAQAAERIGGGAIGRELDVTDHTAFTAFLDEVEEELGPLGALINNAGIMPTGLLAEESPESTDRQIAINLGAVIHGTREAVRRMQPRGHGHIVNISSAAGKLAAGRAATYCGTKFGVLGFSEAVSYELQGTGVEISVVMPSFTNTDLVSGMTPIRGMKFIDPSDVAGSIVAALQKPRFEVPVPGSLSVILKLNQLLPHRARVGLARLSNADSVIADADQTARAGYEERMKETIESSPRRD